MKNVLYPDESLQDCLEYELADQSIPFVVVQPKLNLSSKGRPLRQTTSPDFVCYDKSIVELKAVSAVTDERRAQVHHYLGATGNRPGLPINFGHFPKLQSERIVL